MSEQIAEREAIVESCIACGKDGHHWNECREHNVHDMMHKAFGLTPIFGWQGEHRKDTHNG